MREHTVNLKNMLEALLKKKNLSRRRKLMPWYAIERCLLGVIKLIKTGT